VLRKLTRNNNSGGDNIDATIGSINANNAIIIDNGINSTNNASFCLIK